MALAILIVMRSLASQPSVGAATVPLRLPGSTATAPTDPHGPPYDAAHPAAIRVATAADHAAFSTTAACAAAALATAVLAADAVVTISISATASIAAATAPIAAATATIAAAAVANPPPVPYSPFVTVVGTRFYRAGVLQVPRSQHVSREASRRIPRCQHVGREASRHRGQLGRRLATRRHQPLGVGR